jgi:hypothetical protein
MSRYMHTACSNVTLQEAKAQSTRRKRANSHGVGACLALSQAYRGAPELICCHAAQPEYYSGAWASLQGHSGLQRACALLFRHQLCRCLRQTQTAAQTATRWRRPAGRLQQCRGSRKPRLRRLGHCCCRAHNEGSALGPARVVAYAAQNARAQVAAQLASGVSASRLQQLWRRASRLRVAGHVL